MSAVVVISITGEDGLKVADLDAGTIITPKLPERSKLKEVADLRTSRTSISKGVNLAVVVSRPRKVASGHYEG